MSYLSCISNIMNYFKNNNKNNYITADYEDITIDKILDTDIILPVKIIRTLYFNSLKELLYFPDKKSIKSLDLSNMNLSTIDFIYEFRGLENLNLSNNNIQDLSQLHHLFHLKRLNLSNNKLSSLIHLGKCLNLEVLFLDNNNITNIDELKVLSDIKIIDIGQNPIRDINDLDELKKIEYVYLPYFCKSKNLERKLKNNIYENLSGRVITSYKIYFSKYYLSYIGFGKNRLIFNY